MSLEARRRSAPDGKRAGPTRRSADLEGCWIMRYGSHIITVMSVASTVNDTAVGPGVRGV
jgi:hypothetical protein